MKEYNFEVNGYIVQAKYDENDIESVYIPLLEKWTHLRKKLNKRIIVGIAACPGSGKSTFVSFLEYLYKDLQFEYSLQTVGMDGFHYTNDYLEKNDLKKEKGSPNTFDVEKLKNKIIETKQENCSWPIYSRKIHNPIESGVFVDGDIIILEGNYLLSNQGLWKELYDLFDDTVFLYVDKSELKSRLIQRKAKGCSMDEAISFYEHSDQKNIEYVLKTKRKADVEIELKNNRVNKYTMEEK